MISIDILTIFKFNGIVGPVGTIKRLLKNREYFLYNDCDITVFCNHHLYKEWIDVHDIPPVNKMSWKKKIQRAINNWSAKNYWASAVMVEMIFHHYRNIVRNYIQMNRNPDVVVFHEEMSCYLYLKMRKEHKAKIVLFFHNDGKPLQMFQMYYPKIVGTGYLRRLLQRYEYTIQHVDQCAFICEAGLHQIQALYPVSKGKSSLIINGIDDLTDTEKEYIQERNCQKVSSAVRLCCVGSVSVRKGQRHIIEALARLAESVRNMYHLTIVGDGTDIIHCRQLVKLHRLENVVTFIGSVPNQYVYRHLADADVFLLLSRNEGMPISIIEAMRAGLAVISTNVSGIPELVSSDNGVLIDPDSDSLVKVLSDVGRYDWNAMGKQSRKRYEEKFTFDRMREDYKNMMLKIMK